MTSNKEPEQESVRNTTNSDGQRKWGWQEREEEEKQERVFKPREQNLQARVVAYWTLKQGLGKCWQSRVSAGDLRNFNK